MIILLKIKTKKRYNGLTSFLIIIRDFVDFPFSFSGPTFFLFQFPVTANHELTLTIVNVFAIGVSAFGAVNQSSCTDLYFLILLTSSPHIYRTKSFFCLNQMASLFYYIYFLLSKATSFIYVYLLGKSIATQYKLHRWVDLNPSSAVLER